MSIINEALRKAGEESKKSENIARKEKQEDRIIRVDQPKRTLKEPKESKKFVFFMIFLILIVGVIFAKRFLKIPQNKEINKEQLTTSNQDNKLPASETLPQLNLNGIVYDEERPYAIVNNKVLLKGEVIEGATLTEINRDSVKFVFKDKELEIKAK